MRREPRTSAMNQLNVSLQYCIVTLSALGWSAHKVARELGFNREITGRYLRPVADAAKLVIPDIRLPDSTDRADAAGSAGCQCNPARDGGRCAGLSLLQPLIER